MYSPLYKSPMPTASRSWREKPMAPCGLCGIRGAIGQHMLDPSAVPGCPVSIEKGKPVHQCKLVGSLSYSLGPAGNSNDSTPCTNRPIPCPFPDCKATIWSYSIEAHNEAHHAAAEKPSLSLAYHETDMVKQLLHRAPKRRKVLVQFLISNTHYCDEQLRMTASTFLKSELLLSVCRVH